MEYRRHFLSDIGDNRYRIANLANNPLSVARPRMLLPFLEEDVSVDVEQ